jgi:hypothetical protein
MNECLQETYYEFEEIKPQVLTHLINLESNFKSDLSDLTLSQLEWIRNAIAVTAGEKQVPFL